MKKYLVLCLFTIIFISGFAKDGQWILDKLEKNSNFKSTYSKAKMSIISNGKTTSTMEFEGFSKKKGDNTYQLSRYYYPARLKGTAILSKEGNIWYYNKRSNRVRLLSSSAKKGSMMGSSFSYDDMEMDYSIDFTSDIIEENSKSYTLNLFPKDKDKKYKFLKVYVIKDFFLVDVIEYYDKNEIKYKTLKVNKYKQFGEKWYEVVLEMTDNINNKITKIETFEDSIMVDIDISDSEFSERKLKR